MSPHHTWQMTHACTIYLPSIPNKEWGFSAIINSFTATEGIYTSQKRPCRWPRAYIYVQPQFRFYAFVKARPSMWLLLHVSEVSSSSVRWSLLAFLGLVHWENNSSMRRVFLSKWRETALWMFPDATQAGTSCTLDGFRDDGDRGDSTFGLVESEGNGNDRGDWLGEETGDGGAWWKENDHTARSCEWKLRYSNSQWTLVFVEGSSVWVYEHHREWNIASQLSGEFQSGSAASKRWRNNNQTLERPSKLKKSSSSPSLLFVFSGYRWPVKISTSGVAAGTQAVTAPGAFAFKPRENRNFGAIICLDYVTFSSRGIALRVSLTMKNLSLPSESEITLPKFAKVINRDEGADSLLL